MSKYYFDKKIIPDTLAEIIFNMPENGKRRSPAEFFYETLFAKFMESDKLVQKYWNVRYDIESLTSETDTPQKLKEKLKNGVFDDFTYDSVEGGQAKDICANWFIDDVFSNAYDTLDKRAKKFDEIISSKQKKIKISKKIFVQYLEKYMALEAERMVHMIGSFR